MKIGVQISSLRPFLKMAGEVRETFIKMKKIGYDYAQIQWISPDVTDSEINAALRESGLVCVGTQEAMDEVLPNIEKYIEKNLLWGGKYITVGSLGAADDFKSREGCVKIAERFNRANEKLRGTGLILAFHPLKAIILAEPVPFVLQEKLAVVVDSAVCDKDEQDSRERAGGVKSRFCKDLPPFVFTANRPHSYCREPRNAAKNRHYKEYFRQRNAENPEKTPARSDKERVDVHSVPFREHRRQSRGEPKNR